METIGETEMRTINGMTKEQIETELAGLAEKRERWISALDDGAPEQMEPQRTNRQGIRQSLDGLAFREQTLQNMLRRF